MKMHRTYSFIALLIAFLSMTAFKVASASQVVQTYASATPGMQWCCLWNSECPEVTDCVECPAGSTCGGTSSVSYGLDGQISSCSAHAFCGGGGTGTGGGDDDDDEAPDPGQ